MALICVVDDDVSIRGSLGNLLKSLGYRSIGFASGEEFLASEVIDQADCALLDLRMKGMHGFDVLRQLRAEGKCFGVICMSAHGDDLTVQRAMEVGAVAFLRKPFFDEQLIESLHVALLSRD